MTAKWYILRVRVNAEESTLLSINAALSNSKGYDKELVCNKIEKLEILKKTVVQFRNGKKSTKNMPVYPGYILVYADMNNEIIDFFKKHYFGSFLSVNNIPSPITDLEYQKMIDYVESINQKSTDKTFKIGDEVKVSAGSFSSMTGVIENVNNEKKELKLIVPIFGQDTRIDVAFSDVTIIEH